MIYTNVYAKLLIVFATLIIASCANNTRPYCQVSFNKSCEIDKSTLQTEFRGRLALNLAPDPSQNGAQQQSFSGSFELTGNARLGKLLLFSPLGSTIAALNWAPGLALLDTGGATRQFDSLDALLISATGAALPIDSLFAWLNGLPATSPGWTPDLSDSARGRITARRAQPAPAVELRVILD